MSSLVDSGAQVGRYALTRRLGRGGFAEVWEAEDGDLHRKVAIKIALPALCEEAEFIQRFLREARRSANLEHPHILTVYDFGMHGDRPYLVMPVVPGGSLADRISPPPAAEDSLRWLGELASALDYAHEQGVIHRDVKAQNALLDRRGRLLLTDFGIAKSLAESIVLTQTGAAVGTPAYMAPEQALAQPETYPVGPAADQYAVGVLAYRMLTGRFPFDGSTFTLLRKTIEEAPPPPSTFRLDVSPEVDAVFARVLAKRAVDRFETCGAFVASLWNVLASDAGPPMESRGSDGSFVTPRATEAMVIPLRFVQGPGSSDPGTDLVSPRPFAGSDPAARQTGADAWTDRLVSRTSRVAPPYRPIDSSTPILLPLASPTPSPSPIPEVAGSPTPPAAPVSTASLGWKHRQSGKGRRGLPTAFVAVLTVAGGLLGGGAWLVRTRADRTDAPPDSPATTVPLALATPPTDPPTATPTIPPTVPPTPEPVFVGVPTRSERLPLVPPSPIPAATPTPEPPPAATPTAPPSPTPAPVAPAVIGRAGVEWMEIPQGSFTMGCTQGDEECGNDEVPARDVMITRGVLMAATETTNAQYRVCVEAVVCEPPHERSAFDSRTMASHPVGNVDWRQAKTFCEWAGGRLPTEAEWELAARGGRQGWRYPWGSQESPGDANLGGTGGRDVFRESSPVKSFDPNGFGLYDISGNVWEWCADWYDPGYYSRFEPADPKGPAKGKYRVLRGGGWRNLDPAVLRVSARFKFLPGHWFDYFGFRCVRDHP